MLLRIPSVLDPNQLDTVRKLLADAKFVDGKLSAGAAAQRVKHNQELDKGARQMDILNNIVMNGLVQHPIYRAGALPLRVAAPYYARYTPGMAYGDHLDDPHRRRGYRRRHPEQRRPAVRQGALGYRAASWPNSSPGTPRAFWP